MSATNLPVKTVTTLFRDSKLNDWRYQRVVWASDGRSQLKRVEHRGLTPATVQRLRRYHLAVTNGQSWSGAVKVVGNA